MRRIFYYFFVPFGGLFLVLLMHVFTGDSIHSTAQDILNAFALASIGALLIGACVYLYENKWGPNKRKRLLSRSPFKELEQIGFRPHEEFYIGKVNEYTCLVSFEWNSGRYSILVQLLFDPATTETSFLTLHELREMAARPKLEGYRQDRFEWERNAIGYRLDFIRKPASAEEVLETARVLEGILKGERLSPISAEATEQALPRLRKWISENEEEQGFI